MIRTLTRLWLLLLAAGTGYAQNPQTSADAIHYIKLGNTLRAVDKPQDAINLLLRAVPLVQNKDPYWEAVAYEHLGMAYSDQENSLNAVRYYQKALDLYRKLNYSASEAAMRQLIDESTGKDYYAGIDIGSSGVKLAIFRTRFENGFFAKDIKAKPLAPNVTLVSGTTQSFEAARKVLQTYMDSVRRYRIPNKRIYVAFSSGINIALGKTPDKKQKLYALLSAILPNDSLRIDTTLTAAREAELFAIGALPRRVWSTTSCIDIGSGNTKGGYFEADRTFHPISFPFGTKTLAALIDGKQSPDMDTYRQRAQEVAQAIADTMIDPELRNGHPGLQQRRTVGLGGGISWAMVACLHPEKAGVTAVPITAGDVAQFKRLCLLDFQALINPDLSDITDPAVRAQAEKDILNVRSQFNEKQFIAGALMLEAVYKAYTSGPTPKRFVFIRDSDIGWVTGKFLEDLNHEYERRLAGSAR